MSSQHYVDEANNDVSLANRTCENPDAERALLARAQVNATLAVAASIHDLISHLRGVTPSRPFDTQETPQ